MLLDIDKKSPEKIAALDSEGNQISYGDLVAFSGEVKKILPARSLVFMLTRNNIGGIAWSLGMMQSQVVPLLLNAQTDKELIEELKDRYTPSFFCLPSDLEDSLEYSVVHRAYGYSLLATTSPIYALHDELSHLLPTSGSTGSPKLVRHCYKNIEAAGVNISTLFELTVKDRALMVLPLYYTMGLSMVFSHLKAGATILITNLSMTDSKFWSFIKDQRATSFTGVPYSFDILSLMRFFRMDLPSLNLLTQGGGRMEKGLNEKFARHCLSKGMRWIATYGQTEGTARMAYLPPQYALSKIGSIGIAVPNGELSLLDEDGRIITEPNTEGEMCYRGGNVTMGYAYKKEDLTLGNERNGFIKTGDLAYRDEDGCYYIVGRLGRFLKLYGMRIGLDECEHIVKAKFTTECACVGDDTRMTVFITVEGIEDAVKKELVEKTQLVASAFEVKVIQEMPKSEAGKILYKKLNKIIRK